jgi:hypothetical protein
MVTALEEQSAKRSEEELLNLVIDRAKWERGQGNGALLRDGKMCCLGFLARECGLGAKTISGVGVPSDFSRYDGGTDTTIPRKVRRHQEIWNAVLGKIKPRLPFTDARAKATDVEDVLVMINDEAAMTDARRERFLTKEFAKIGVKVTFVGEQA